MFGLGKTKSMPDAGSALPGRDFAIPTAATHFVSGRALKGPYPEGLQRAMFGMGCFWGVERIFWKLPGVWVTAVGYTAGMTPNATYQEVCSGATGHNEVVLVVYDPAIITYETLLKTFWEGHDPTQGMRQGNDIGTQYRSGIYTFDDEQAEAAQRTRMSYQRSLNSAGMGKITTEIKPANEFYYAEDYHQQYLAKMPHGYCGIGGTGIDCTIETAA